MRLRILLTACALVALLGACGGKSNSPKASTGGDGKGGGPTATAIPKPIVLDNATTTASGLKYVDTVVGTGPVPAAGQQVTVHYTGRLAATGAKFDSSVDSGQPVTLPLTGIMPGLAEALSTMKVGGKRTAYIPAALGFGARPVQGVPPNSDLVYDIELLAAK